MYQVEKWDWISIDQQLAIEEILKHNKLGLSQVEIGKLHPLLLSILYAEDQKRKQGKKLSRWIENLLSFLGLSSFFCSTLGPWNLHLCHAKRFGYSKRGFARAVKGFPLATQFVVTHLIEDIGLDKSPERILAEYNHNVCATSVAALQKGLNTLLHLDLPEDGLVGPNTRDAILQNPHLFPPDFSMDPLDELHLSRALSHFERKFGINCCPFIPERIVRKDWQYVFQKPLSFHRWKGFFEQDIDVRAYVKTGMSFYTLIYRGESS